MNIVVDISTKSIYTYIKIIDIGGVILIKQIKDCRNEKKFSQLEVAEMVGISQSHYCEIENGTATPSVAVAKAIAKALDFDWTRFYEDSDEQEKTN